MPEVSKVGGIFDRVWMHDNGVGKPSELGELRN
jgi:hypothetical protein